MPFDLNGFKKAKFETRTDEVRVDGMAEWFGENERPVFVVRGLTGEEVARCREATEQNQNISDMVQALVSSQQHERVEALREMLGVSESVPNDIARRLQQLTLGSVDPDLDHEAAVLMAERFPIEFYHITTRIMELTGEGQQPVKKKDSSKTQA